jgi:hypothetical protein
MGDQREFDLRAKLRKDQNPGRQFGGGASHCFNCNRDRHYQASCTNPPFCNNCRKDGHRALACLAKKGFNLRLCGFGLQGQ